jgi:uroporphyrin-III C-methyltransferase
VTEATGGRDGRVALVGGGPGDPGLVTVRGLELLQQADVVLVDRLAPHGLLDRLRQRVEVIEVGKRPHGAGISQEQINEILVDRAAAGLRVVRLKGGDPFVFGRGAEEMQACAQAGIPCDVVPGVTSAVAAPAAAGIPLTHRGLSQQVTVVSGHCAPSDPKSTTDWKALAQAGGTLVLLMAVTHLGEIATALVDGGRDPATPSAVVCSATTPSQRVLTADLQTIAQAARAAQVDPPAVVVIGEVAGL